MDRKPLYKPGQVVLYTNGDTHEIGIIKSIVDGRGSEPLYRVWYHTGDTTAVTAERSLKPFVNAYAFKITRLDPDGNERQHEEQID